MNTVSTYLGKEASYWVELDARAKDLNVESILQELVAANALLRYYEGHFDDILRYRETVRGAFK